MICTHIELTMDTTQPRDVAKAMLKFWRYQAEQARQQYSICTHVLSSYERANEQAIQDYRRANEDSCGWGGGPALPYSKAEIERQEALLPTVTKHYEEARAMLGYIVNFITDRAHPEASK